MIMTQKYGYTMIFLLQYTHGVSIIFPDNFHFTRFTFLIDFRLFVTEHMVHTRVGYSRSARKIFIIQRATDVLVSIYINSKPKYTIIACILCIKNI